MINLSPIAKKIQKRLFEKTRILSRESSPNAPASDLNLYNLSSRAVWSRMTSGLAKPIILMGGELRSDKEIAAGHSQQYNNKHRPLPGINDISVGFRGGLKTLREATINWTCWSFDEIERLTPHFLSVGKTVLVEWGWVYNKKSLSKLPTFINSSGAINASAYTDYKNVVINANGDFDMIVAIVKNFEFKTRSDGGFDCTTTISGMGTNMLKNVEPHKNQLASTTKLNISENDTVIKLKEESKNPKPETEVPMTIKIMVEQLDLYLATKRFDFAYSTNNRGQTMAEARNRSTGVAPIIKKYKDQRVIATFKTRKSYFLYEPNQWIMEYDYFAANPSTYGKTINSWVRWGWFEDNILSKFTTTVSSNSATVGPPPAPIVNSEFRSVEKLISSDGDEGFEYEATRVRNHPNFDTIDLNKFIIPGQYTPFKPPNKAPDEIKGDDKYFHRLASIVNENFNNFRPTTSIVDSVSYTVKSGDSLSAIGKKFGVNSDKIAQSNDLKSKNNIKVGQKLNISASSRKAGGATGKEDKTTGYFRNLLINTKLIKEAFGVSDDDSFSNESTNVNEALEQMIMLLNQDVQIWDLAIVNDEIEQYRSKIVDSSLVITLPDVKEKISSPFLRSKTSRSTYSGGDVTNNGIFYFPAWSHDSIVLSQDISSTIPDAMALSIMYGANADKYTTAGSAPAEAGDEEANAVASVGVDPNNKDTKLNGISTIINKAGYENYGYKEGEKNAHVPITPCYEKGGEDNLKKFFTSEKLSKIFEQTTKQKRQTIAEQEQPMQDSKLTTIDDVIDDSIPPPLPNILAIQGIDAFEQLALLDGGDHPLVKLYSSKYDNNSKMKPQFIDSVRYNMQTAKVTKETITDTNRPLKLPMELDLTIDGIGGIYPGNSYHSEYLPKRYKDECLFQAFDIDHKVDSSGWTTTISGKMRTTVDRMAKTSTKTTFGVDILSIQDQFNKSLSKASNDTLKAETTTETTGANTPGQQQGYQDFK